MSLARFVRWFRVALAVALALAGLACTVSCSSSSGPTVAATVEYVGTVEGTNVLVGLVVTNGQALLFFCGAGDTLTTLTHWMHGSVTLGKAFALTDGTASATGAASGSLNASHLSGTFTPSASAKPMAWSADFVTGSTLAGVYTDQLSAGLVALIVLQAPDAGTTTAQGAFHDLALKDEILQVTPLNPLALTPQGIAADVVVNGATQEVFLTPAVGD
jgi:hypothetical protein